MEEHTGIVNSARFSSDEKYIVTASSDKSICTWDVGSGSDECLEKG